MPKQSVIPGLRTAMKKKVVPFQVVNSTTVARMRADPVVSGSSERRTPTRH